MATAWPPSQLLALPQELRTKIYEELLCPEPAKVHTLWHDREGRRGPFNFHPSILRVNKQTHFEAILLLYDKNTLEIDLTTNVVQDCLGNYPDGRPDPPPLFQKDAVSAAPYVDEVPAANTYLPIGEAKGVISAHSFQRLHHIELRTKTVAIWGYSSTGDKYFSHTGQLIMRILQLLTEQHCIAPSAEQTFKFILVPDFLTYQGIFGVGRSDATDVANVIGMLELLGRIMQKRSVLVEESIRPINEGNFPPLKKVKVDVNARLAQVQDLVNV